MKANRKLTGLTPSLCGGGEKACCERVLQHHGQLQWQTQLIVTQLLQMVQKAQVNISNHVTVLKKKDKEKECKYASTGYNM